ncbi:DNRLRE domain-containing protein [Aminobacterium colombiense]|jgi:hypothetical protein|uniref:DNRLRE domain-containing protein n=1 Tax=Aminobacterium colombiense TaxID=81468 RepID=UPI0025992A3D|nr:DNRLRE domain-containing protein [uncultured Aminobacterium sp.]
MKKGSLLFVITFCYFLMSLIGLEAASAQMEREEITYVLEVAESIFATSGNLGDIDYSNKSVLSHPSAALWLRTSDINVDGNMKLFRSFLKFNAGDMASLPSGADIDGAALWMYTYGSGYDHDGISTATVRELSSNNWSENTLHWGNMPTSTVRVISTRNIPRVPGCSAYDFNIALSHIARWRNAGGLFSFQIRSNITRSFRSHRDTEGIPHIRMAVSYDAIYVSADITQGSWSNSPVTVRLSFHDNDGVGIVRKQYRWSQSAAIPSSGWLNVPTNNRVTQSNQGIWYLHVRTEDGSGNINYTITSDGIYAPVGQGKMRTNNTTVGGPFGPYRIDLTPPVIFFRNIADTEDYLSRDWEESPVSMRVKVSDAGGSGYNGTRYVWSQSNEKPSVFDWGGYSINSNWVIFQSIAGEWYLHVEARDGAGNVSYRYEGPYRISVRNRLRTRLINN